MKNTQLSIFEKQNKKYDTDKKLTFIINSLNHKYKSNKISF
jgi:hypothetical protein